MWTTYIFWSLIALLILLVVVVHIWWKQRVSAYTSQGIKGPTPIPLLGNALQLKRYPHDVVEQFKEWSVQFQYRFMLWMGPVPCLISGSLVDAEAILGIANTPPKAKEYRFLKPWLGTGVLMSEGQKWRTRRKMLTPAFTIAALSNSVDIIKKNTSIYVSKLKRFARSGEIFDICPLSTLCTLDIICEEAMGVDIQAQTTGEKNRYVCAVLKLSHLIQKRMKSVWLWPNCIFNLTSIGREHNALVEESHAFTLGVIKKRIATREKDRNGKGPTENSGSFLDILLDSYDRGEIDLEGVREEVDTFMLEGHESTAASINFTLYCLGLDPEIQSKVQKEIDRSLDTNAGDLEATIKEMALLDRVIKESMRMFTPVPMVGRTLDKDVKAGDTWLYKGLTVALPLAFIHTNPALWEDPQMFNPDRFLPENISKRPLHSYLPFSAGKRNCIGQRLAMLEQRIILATVLHNFNVESVDEREDLKISGELVLRSQNGVKLKLTERNPIKHG